MLEITILPFQRNFGYYKSRMPVRAISLPLFTSCKVSSRPVVARALLGPSQPDPTLGDPIHAQSTRKREPSALPTSCRTAS